MAGTTVAKLNFQYAADATGFMQTTKDIENKLGSLTSTVTTIAGSIAAAFATSKIIDSISFGVKLASDAEQAKVAFEVMTGSANNAVKLLKEIEQLSAATPFKSSGLRDSARTLMAFGVGLDDIIPSLRMLGDISGGNEQKLSSLALVFGQISSAGKLTGGDLLQLVNAGFNPLQEMAGGSAEKYKILRKEMEAGNITFQMVKESFQRATSEGGLFFGMMDKQSQTIAGRFSTLQENTELLARGIGEVLAPATSKLIEEGIKLTDVLKNMDTETVKNTAAIVAFAGAFTVSMILFPKVISGINSLIVAYRSLTVAQIILNAVSNPANLVRVIASLGIAAIAAVAVKESFDSLTDANKRAKDTALAAANEATNAVTKIGDIGNSAASATKNATQATAVSIDAMNTELESLKGQLESVKDKGDKARDALRQQNQFTAAAERFTMAGFEAVLKGDANNAIQKAIEKQTEEERRNTAKLEDKIRRLETAIKASKITVREGNVL